MMQRTANEYAACERRICKRSDQPKINRITNNDARLILRKQLSTVANVGFSLNSIMSLPR